MLVHKYLLLISSVSIFGSCHKPCDESDHRFSISNNFTEEKESINIGDTLWLSCMTPTRIYDLNTQQVVDFKDAENFGSALTIADITKFHSDQRGAVDSFNFVASKGDIYTNPNLDPTGTKQLKFGRSDTTYVLKIGVIALKRGTYIFSISDVPDVFRNHKGKCGKATFEILNNNINKHLYLFENLWGPLSIHDAAHSYCFKVN